LLFVRIFQMLMRKKVGLIVGGNELSGVAGAGKQGEKKVGEVWTLTMWKGKKTNRKKYLLTSIGMGSQPEESTGR